MQSSYSRWDGTQNPLGDDIDIGAVLEEMADELLSGYGVDWSLRELQRRGMRGRRGLDDMLRSLRQQRRRIQRQTNLEGPLEEVRRALDRIISAERRALAADTSDDARVKEAMLDAVPRHPAGAINELRHYDFNSPEAAAEFEALMESLRREVLDSFFKSMMGSMQNITPDDVAALNEMLAELNDMVAADRRGDDYDFEGFMQRHGRFFPENPRNLQELLDILARRMVAMSRMLASMSPEQRQQLAELASSVLQDLDLAWQMDQLNQSLRELMPELPWDEASAAVGDDMMPMSAAVDAFEEIGEIEQLEEAIAGTYPGATIDDIDEEALRRSLGEDAVKDLRWLKEIERALEAAGLARRERGRLKLTPRGARMIGERSLTNLLERIRREPTHRTRGDSSEPTGQTRPWTFGDSDPISVQKTVYNAVVRSGPSRGVRLHPEDFELIESESRPQTATALLLDLSMSMPLRGHWIPAKRMALSLHALIQSKYPQDSLYLIGFSSYARRMSPAELAGETWGEEQGTNMQHAFMLARRELAEDPRPIKQVIMVTDGEPTAHLEDGYAMFNWPPIRQTIEKTLREGLRLSRSHIAINVFMLEESPGLVAFMQRLSRMTGGQIVQTPSASIGREVIGTYLRRNSA
jgi:uncharacterized protein with von Willebrand factor type A (vWA) domain